MKGSILVVDDDEKVLEILKESLSRNGYRVRVASDGQKALRSYMREAPDMVVLDIMLPDLDGREVLKEMRALERGEDVPVLFLSANSDLEVKLSGLDIGADDYLVKPFSLKELNSKIDKMLDRFSKTRKLEEAKQELETEISKEHENYIQINKELKKQILSMKTLFSVAQDLNRLLDPEELINVFALTIMGELQISSMAFLSLKREDSRDFTLQELKGFERRKFANLSLDRYGAFARWLGEHQRPRKIVRNPDRKWVRKLPDLRLAVFEYATPIVVRQDLKGIVFTGPKLNNKEYNSCDLEMLLSICNSAGIGMENARLFRQLQITYLSTVKTLVSIIEAKDAYTRGHTERVADYAMAIAEKMRLSREQRRLIAFGAVLHDIGKLGVYEDVLNKTGKLSDEEWSVLKSHPEVGASIIENMEFLGGTVALVRHHHEKYDGTGYPDGLKREEIPLGARIIAVADSFDAMTTDRSYRQKFAWRKAVETLKSKSGTQFDPRVVEGFIALLEEGAFGAEADDPEKV